MSAKTESLREPWEILERMLWAMSGTFAVFSVQMRRRPYKAWRHSLMWTGRLWALIYKRLYGPIKGR